MWRPDVTGLKEVFGATDDNLETATESFPAKAGLIQTHLKTL